LPSGLDLDEDAIDYVTKVLEESIHECRAAFSTASPATESGESGKPDEAEAPVFGPAFAEAYDALYAEKDYRAEVTVLERCFERFSSRMVHRVLDVGCGTGRHSEELAARGYEVVGVDRSASMLGIARTRVASARFVESDMRDLDLGETFDAVTILFAALSYQTTSDAILAALRGARRHLEPGGLLVADVWFGTPSGDRGAPPRTFRRGHSDGVTWERRGTLARDPLEQKVRVTFELRRCEAGTETVTTETHDMHYFSPFELEFALRSAGFRLAALTAEESLERAPGSSDLTALFVAIAC
jgi:SAM-dependent methyltransferase